MSSVSRRLPPVIQLRPYQQAWIDDPARFCLAVKSARIGFSYGTGLRRLFRCLEHENRTATVLSASKAQSIEFVEQLSRNIKAIGATMQLFDEYFADADGKTEILQQRIQLPNGARIIALPANPRTARGYPGDAVLDEFGHHEDSYSIWAAIARQVALGNELDVLSTPNGEIGKFFDLAKEFGLTDGVAPEQNPLRQGPWSCHWVDVNMAIAQGCPIDMQQMRDLFKDEQAFAQEFLCVFLKAVGSWLTNELIQMAENDGATIDWPAGYQPAGRLVLGVDVGRSGDRTTAWLDEYIGDVAWTRMVLRLWSMPFFGKNGQEGQAERLLPWFQLASRGAIDSTGMGVGLYDWLDREVRGRVIGINFAGSDDKGVKIKTRMAIDTKARMEKGLDRIPRDPQIRQELLAIKREQTSGGVKFDAPRIEVDSAVSGGERRKVYAHADAFWAKALANYAAQGAPAAVMSSIEERGAEWTRGDRRGAMSEAARGVLSPYQQEEPQPAMVRERRSLFA